MFYDVDDLPEIDILLITHDHYDHLDYPTIKKLKNKVAKIIVPLGSRCTSFEMGAMMKIKLQLLIGMMKLL